MDEIGTKQGQGHTTAERREVYQPTFRTMLGITLMAIIASTSSLFTFVKTGRVIPAVLASVFIGILLAMRFKMRLVVDQDRIEYSGLFSRRTIRFSEVIHAGWMYEHGLSRDRFFGSLVYEVLSRKERIKINFRLFSMDQLSGLIQKLESLPVLPDTTDQSLRRAGTESMERSSAQSTNTNVEK